MQIHHLGRVDCLPTLQAMQAYTDARQRSVIQENSGSPAYLLTDQLWICEHPAVFTQGLAGRSEHLLRPGDIPVVQTNRGGQVTYHGPGQVVAYPLLDLQHAGYYVKEYVYKIEEAVIRTLAAFNITGHRVRGAPGIYVRPQDPSAHAALNLTEADLKQMGSDPIYKGNPLAHNSNGDKLDLTPFNSGIGKIAALGVKVSRHHAYHGVALNVAMDLEPYSRINPCGYAGLPTVDMASLGVQASWDEVAAVLAQKLVSYLAA